MLALQIGQIDRRRTEKVLDTDFTVIVGSLEKSLISVLLPASIGLLFAGLQRETYLFSTLRNTSSHYLVILNGPHASGYFSLLGWFMGSGYSDQEFSEAILIPQKLIITGTIVVVLRLEAQTDCANKETWILCLEAQPQFPLLESKSVDRPIYLSITSKFLIRQIGKYSRRALLRFKWNGCHWRRLNLTLLFAVLSASAFATLG